MKKHSLLAITIMTIIFFFHMAKNVSAVELITNGGFETGTFAGWTVSSSIGNTWYPWQVTAAGGGSTTGEITTSSPLFGTRSAWNGFCCNITNNPEYIQQDITIPAGNGAVLTWSDKIQSNLTSFCPVPACGSNTWRVQILNTSNVVLQTLYTFTANGGANYDTGWVTHNASLNAYSGQTIRIRFSGTYVSTMPRHENGPGRMEVDGVSVDTMPILAAEVSVSGRIIDVKNNGLSKVAVTLTDANGNSQTVYSNSFGVYRFEEVPVGQTYVLAVNHRRYFFFDNPQVVTVNDELTNIDFQASP